MGLSSDWLILFDEGNVLNNNTQREYKYYKALGEYMVNLYGGESNRWIEISSQYFDKFVIMCKEILSRGDIFYNDTFIRNHMINWSKALFAGYNLSIPNDQELVKFFKESTKKICPQAIAPPKGIIDVLSTLYNNGFNICTSSTKLSFELKEILSGMKVDLFFQTLYGPDLIHCGKFSSDFYRKIIDDKKMNPSNVIVVDDNPIFLEMAKPIGITTIQSNSCILDRPQSDIVDYLYTDSNDLISIIAEITGITIN